MKQLPLSLPTYSGPTFDNFVPGSNLDCLTYLQESAATFERGQLPVVYMWGGAGAGKTHLLQSAAQIIMENGGKCISLTPTNHVDVDAALTADLIVLDDCDQFSIEQQATAFRLFIEAQSTGSWIVAAGSLPPVNLEVREDLRSRLGWGTVFALKPLNDEELQAALWHAFHSRGLVLQSNVQDYLLNHFARDMSSLMHLLNKLDRYALASKRAITIPLIKSMFEEGSDETNGRVG